MVEAYEILNDQNKRNSLDALLVSQERYGQWALPIDIRINIDLTLREAFLGGKKTIQYLKTILRSGNPTVSLATLEIEIPKRCSLNTTLKIEQAGNILSNTEVGNLYVVISYPMEEDGIIVDRWGNMTTTIDVPWYKVLQENTILFSPFANSEEFPILLNHCNTSGSVYQIPNAGMLANSTISVKVFYKLPVNMSSEDCLKIAEILKHYG